LFISSALLIVNFYGLAIAATKEQQDTNRQNGKKPGKNTVEIKKLKWPGRRASDWLQKAYKNNLASNKNAEDSIKLNLTMAQNVSY